MYFEDLSIGCGMEMVPTCQGPMCKEELQSRPVWNATGKLSEESRYIVVLGL